MDTRGLLGSLLQAGLSRSGRGRFDNALGGSGVGDILSRVLSGGGRPSAPGAAPVKPGGGILGNVPMGAAGLGALAGAVLGGRKGGTLQGVIGGGALAILGKLALESLQKSGHMPNATPQPLADVPEAARITGGAAIDEEAHARLVLEAMVSAAKADGHIDQAEMGRIMDKVDEGGIGVDGKDFLLAEMRKGVDVNDLAARATTPEMAAQVYAASLLAIEVDTESERDYLRRLAMALRLDEATVHQLHRAIGAPA